MSAVRWLAIYAAIAVAVWVIPDPFVGFMLGFVGGGFCAWNFGVDLRREVRERRDKRRGHADG